MIFVPVLKSILQSEMPERSDLIFLLIFLVDEFFIVFSLPKSIFLVHQVYQLQGFYLCQLLLFHHKGIRLQSKYAL